MKKKISDKKLSLNKETLRKLNDSELGKVNGGYNASQLSPCTRLSPCLSTNFPKGNAC